MGGKTVHVINPVADEGWTLSDTHKACGENPVQSWITYVKANAA